MAFIKNMALAITIALFLGLSPVPAQATFKYLHKGMTVPEMKGKDLLTGKKVTCGKGDAHDSQVVVMAFWATWSPRSLEVLSDLKGLQEKFGSDKVHVIGINVEGSRVTAEEHEHIIEVIRELDPGFAIIQDKGLEIFDTVGVIAVPSVAVLDGLHVMQCGPSEYSPAIADRIEDSIATALGLKKHEQETEHSASYRPHPKANRYYNLAAQLVNQRHFQGALSNLDRAVAADSNFSPPHSLRGQIHLTLGDADLARESFAHATMLDATAVMAWAGWGRALLRLDQPGEGAAKLEAALDLEEAFTPALLDLASVRARNGNRLAAYELLDRVKALNPRDPEVLYRLGKFHRESGELGPAVDAYRSALEQLIP